MIELGTAVESFRTNAADVRRLLDFDRFVLDLQWAAILKQLPRVKDNDSDPELNPASSVNKSIGMLRGIREHGSLKPHYEVMINQALVLLVSYFGSAVRDLIRGAVLRSIASDMNQELLSFEIKARVDELRDMDVTVEDFIAERVVNSHGYQLPGHEKHWPGLQNLLRL